MNSELETAWNITQERLIFPSASASHPYYISAPHWIYSSAGVRALYLLCHALNKKGFRAFITNHPYGPFHRFFPWTNPELLAPMLTEEEAASHLRAGLCPIALYPETVTGNPLKAPVVARWVMNFPGLLGGDTRFDAGEIRFGYSKELASLADDPKQVLHLPTIDTRIFHPSKNPRRRKGACFFASKFKSVHNGKLLPITDGCFEITRQLPSSPSPRQIAEILWTSEIFYTYENTALATEAVLCGCPAVFIPNPYLQKIIGREELGSDGYAWGTDPREIERARATVDQGAINYLKAYDLFWEQLEQFVAITQHRAARVTYTTMVSVPSWPALPSESARKGVWKPLHGMEKRCRPFLHLLKGAFKSEKGMDTSSTVKEGFASTR